MTGSSGYGVGHVALPWRRRGRGAGERKDGKQHLFGYGLHEHRQGAVQGGE